MLVGTFVVVVNFRHTLTILVLHPKFSKVELKMIYPFNLVNNNIHIEQFHPGTLTTLEVCTNNNVKKWQIVSKSRKIL